MDRSPFPRSSVPSRSVRTTGLCRPQLIVVALIPLLGALIGFPASVDAGGGGSNAIFSLDRTSPSLGVVSPADIFVDDVGNAPGGPLTIALPGTSLGLVASDNVDALSSGRDNGFPSILTSLEPNPLNDPSVRYQFSAARLAIDSVDGLITIPLDPLPVVVGSTTTFTDQFSDDQAADVFDSYDAAPPRVNSVTVFEEQLELWGGPTFPPGAIDNLDALEALGSFGVTNLDGPDPDPWPDVPIYFSVDDLSGPDPGIVWVKPDGPLPRLIYAGLGALGLQPGDDIDALSIWETETPPDYVFSGGDAIVFSLRAGSPSLPMVIDGVTINEGGIFLARPGAGITAALPSGFFSLDEGDDLDAIHVVDPRDPALLPCYQETDLPTVIRPFESLSLGQSAMDAVVGGPPVHITVYLNESERIPDPGVVADYVVTVTVDNPAVATVQSVVPTWCGLVGDGCPDPPDPPVLQCCAHCAPTAPTDWPETCMPWSGPCPGASGSMMGCNVSYYSVTGPNLCLGDIHIRPEGPGTVRVSVAASVNGSTGPIPVLAAEALIRVTSPTAVEGPVQPPFIGYALHENRPNPFNPTTEIQFDVPSGGGEIRLAVFDASGRQVRELVSGSRDPGTHYVTWDGRDAGGHDLASGVYFLRLSTPEGTITRKSVLVR